MNIYNDIAPYYDRSMSYVDYPGWYRYLKRLLKYYHHNPGTLIDLGGGTGSLALQFTQNGYRMDILDKSGPMLREARKKKYAKPVSFFNKDLQHFKLRRRYDTAFCLNNTINYLATKKALHDMFGCCSDILKKNSLLILDNCSPHYYRNYYNGRNFSNKCPGFIYNWRHTYKPERKKAVMYFEIVTDQGKYFREKHINILHADTTVTRAAADHFECLAVLDGFSFKKRHARSKEIYYVMRKKA